MAAVGGTLAAIVGTFSAFRESQRDDLLRSPAVHLACRPEFRAAEAAQGLKAPEETLLLTAAGAQWVHVGGTAPGGAKAPEPFARCEVKNFGRLPVMDVAIPLHLAFAAGAGKDGVATDATVDVPGLSPDASYEFSLLNGTAQPLTFAFGREVRLTRLDTKDPVRTPLYADSRLHDLETQPARPTLASASEPRAGAAGSQPSAAPHGSAYRAGRSATMTIDNFLFKPAQLRVPAGTTVVVRNDDAEAHSLVSGDGRIASGALAPHAQWRYRFDQPGRYALHCDYHPYMQALVVVD